MRVKLKRFACLQHSQDQQAEMVTLPCGATVRTLLKNLMIGKADVGILIVNARSATFDQALSNGDNITIIPPVGGG